MTVRERVRGPALVTRAGGSGVSAIGGVGASAAGGDGEDAGGEDREEVGGGGEEEEEGDGGGVGEEDASEAGGSADLCLASTSASFPRHRRCMSVNGPVRTGTPRFRRTVMSRPALTCRSGSAATRSKRSACSLIAGLGGGWAGWGSGRVWVSGMSRSGPEDCADEGGEEGGNGEEQEEEEADGEEEGGGEEGEGEEEEEEEAGEGEEGGGSCGSSVVGDGSRRPNGRLVLRGTSGMSVVRPASDARKAAAAL